MTVEQYQAMAVIRFGMSIQDFESYTPNEFEHLLVEYQKVQKEKDYNLGEWIRFHLLHMWNMSGKSVKEGNTPDKTWVPLPWDKVHKQTAEEMKAVAYAIAGSWKNVSVDELNKSLMKKKK